MNKVQDIVQIQLPQQAGLMQPGFGEEYGVNIVNGCREAGKGLAPAAEAQLQQQQQQRRKEMDRKKSVVSPAVETGPMGEFNWVHFSAQTGLAL